MTPRRRLTLQPVERLLFTSLTPAAQEQAAEWWTREQAHRDVVEATGRSWSAYRRERWRLVEQPRQRVALLDEAIDLHLRVAVYPEQQRRLAAVGITMHPVPYRPVSRR